MEAGGDGVIRRRWNDVCIYARVATFWRVNSEVKIALQKGAFWSEVLYILSYQWNEL